MYTFVPGVPLLPLSSSGKVLVRDKFWWNFSILFLTLKRVVEGADDAESDEIFRTVHFGSPYDRSPPIFSNVCPKNLPQKVQLGMRLVARLGAFVQIVGSHCTLPRQFSLHDLPWQLCNYLGGKFSSRAACPLFPANSASISEETEGRKRLERFLKYFSTFFAIFWSFLTPCCWSILPLHEKPFKEKN